MTPSAEINEARSSLRAWAANKPEPIPDIVRIIWTNMGSLALDPTSTQLLRITTDNIAKLSRAITARRTASV